MDLDALIEKLEGDLAAARRLRESYGAANGSTTASPAPTPAPAKQAGAAPVRRRGFFTGVEDPVFLAKWHAALADACVRPIALRDALDAMKQKGIDVDYARAFAYLTRQTRRGFYEKKGKHYRLVKREEEAT